MKRMMFLKGPVSVKLKVLILLCAATIVSCQHLGKSEELVIIDSVSGQELEVPAKAPRERVLTAKEQAALTPNQVIDSLRSGNRRFVANDLTLRNHTEMVRKAASGQYPKAVILSCIDSRVPVEDVFDKGIGDMFVVRIAGNIANTDILGSLEYSCKVSGAKVTLVLGHQSCGAIKAAINNYKLGNVTTLLGKLKPAVDKSARFNGEKSDKNTEYVDNVAKYNVMHTIDAIRSASRILKELETKGQIKIVGAYYNINDGEVRFL